MNRVTIKDVAKLAEVAPSTVSFVLNKTKNQTISADTKEKVLAAAKLLAYHPNYMATSIRNKVSKTIGIVTSYNVYSMFFQDMLTGILDVTEKNGYSILLCESNKPASEKANYIQHFLSHRIDGIIYIASAHSEKKALEEKHIELFRRYKIPFITIYGYTNYLDQSYVNINFSQCGFDGCANLISNGCKKILYVAPLDKEGVAHYEPQTEKDKIQGYLDACKVYNIHREAEVIYLPRDFKSKDYNAILELFYHKIIIEGVDGIVACWATFALQILSVAIKKGIGIPETLKVIALDTIPYLEHTYPSLSSMKLPFFEIAKKGAEVLIHNFLEGEENAQKSYSYILNCDISERESSKRTE